MQYRPSQPRFGQPAFPMSASPSSSAATEFDQKAATAYNSPAGPAIVYQTASSDPWVEQHAIPRHRSRASSLASEASSANDSLLSGIGGDFGGSDRRGHQSGNADVSSILSSPVLSDTFGFGARSAKLHPSTSAEGFLCEVVGLSESQSSFWPVNWDELLRLLAQRESIWSEV